jgi:N-acetylglutamate synthase-like GNAT family acetyltransferase
MIKIRKAKKTEIKEIKKLIDSFEEMDVIEETFPEKYYQRILKKGILFVAVNDNRVIGVCFGTYNSKERWSDLLGIAVRKEFRKKGVGTELIKEFERDVRKKKLRTIDLYADKSQIDLFNKLKYVKGRTYAAFRKKIK